MTQTYPHPPHMAPGATAPGYAPQQPMPGMSGPPPMPPLMAPPRPTKPGPRRGWIAAAISAAAVAVFGAGAIGVVVGTHLASTPSGSATSGSETSTATVAQIKEQTIDLCTRFAAGYRAMPSPQNNGFDVVPIANYVADALRDNSAADPDIRSAVETSLSGLRTHIADSSHEPSKGAIQMPRDWSVDRANDADQRVWDLCRAYEG